MAAMEPNRRHHLNFRQRRQLFGVLKLIGHPHRIAHQKPDQPPLNTVWQSRHGGRPTRERILATGSQPSTTVQ